MRRNIRINLKPIPQQPNNATALDGAFIVCPICGKSASWNSHFGGHMCSEGHLTKKPGPKPGEQISYYRDQAAFWKAANASWEPAQLQDELHLAADTVSTLLDECERLNNLWTDAAIRLEESQKEAGELREKLWHAKESLDFARTKDAEIVRLGGELCKATDQLDDLKSALATANAYRRAIQERNQELEAKLGKLKAKMDEPPH